MAIYSKTIGNGYGICAVVGRREIMNAAQKTWISSTFWTERIGPTAALATLKVMERVKSWEVITAIGNSNKNVGRLWLINMVWKLNNGVFLLLPDIILKVKSSCL